MPPKEMFLNLKKKKKIPKGPIPLDHCHPRARNYLKYIDGSEGVQWSVMTETLQLNVTKIRVSTSQGDMGKGSPSPIL